ncbi:hypothetical protein COLO4_35013 [Corchorus olitorius]|uniref:Leucine-rich repeat-containing N-terminal plant-type domain-containing protein n=1 Tax=Corchorus olitorius TaxID=93759 RepID=A0A1R3GIG1_9ROSI|nr:hypothetical protein COLO4_35013 [Corchorus olitorius]
MGLHLSNLALLIFLCQLLTFSFPFAHPLCHGDEQLALLQFKESFIVDTNASSDADHLCVYPKTDEWNGIVDCCSWQGIECDRETGHVIGLNLSKSCLHGSIYSSSSLFRLVHLEKLNLAFNNFSYSKIPSALGSLPRLNYLNLSYSSFSGQIPSEISKLSSLKTLDLSLNFDPDDPYQGLLELKKPDMSSLVRNLTSLKYLDLSLVDVSSPVPSFLANFSSLGSFLCHNCKLFGTFPVAIFQLPNLELLELSKNKDLKGHLPEFHPSNRFKMLSIWNTSFSGELPASIRNLYSLEFLGVSHCNFTGSLPPSLSNLTKLFHLGLENNSFSGEIPSSLSNLTRIKFLSLGHNEFKTSEIPSSLANLVNLERLDLANGQFAGPFPAWLTNMTQLRFLDLSSNELQGQLPSSITRLKNLEFLNIVSNNLSGLVELEIFLKLKNLQQLSLSFNKFTVLSKSSSDNTNNISLPKLVRLRLASCNLISFPDFLRSQDRLQLLDLSLNQIHGLIPKWIWQMSTKTLLQINLSQNLLTGFERSPMVLPWSKLVVLNLRNNMLKGSLPIPPFSTAVYLLSNNSLSGVISPLLCNATSLQVLDVSDNNLDGLIPQCLGNFGKSLQVLNLHDNNFSGPIPQNWTRGRNMLRMINLGQNMLEGQVPRSLIMCKKLQYLDIGHNQINDTFPSWLGTLRNLEVLILRSNRFHGTLETNDLESDSLFPLLRIVDLSNNGFTGFLPSEYFKTWKAMRNLNSEHLTYLQASGVVFTVAYIYRSVYNFSVTLTTKGVKTEFEKVSELLAVIDLSGNRFQGEIPETIANLKGIQLLNLSNNLLVGEIPSAMGSMSSLEALDISQNEIVGRIPRELQQLNFLSVFNVSHNNLTGPIPQASQFHTFDNSSFDGNPGLCGIPLSKKCKDSEPSSTLEGKEDSATFFRFGWQVVLIGYGIGTAFGVIMGHIAFTRKPNWFLKTFGKKQIRRWPQPIRGLRN